MSGKAVPSSGNTGPRDFSAEVHSQFARGGPVPAADRPRVAIDLNVRIGDDLTYSGFDDVEGADAADLARGTAVEVFERESGVHGPAEVAGLDRERKLVYLKVNWRSIVS